jgi:hypothetical protein
VYNHVFPVFALIIQILENIGSLTVYFLGDFNDTFRLIFSCPSADVPSFVEKYPKIKYATIFDRPHNLEMELCETSFKLVNGWY